MKKLKKLTPEIKAAIVKAVQQNKRYADISAQFGVAKSTISYTMKLFKATGNVDRRPKSGRPRLTTDKDDKVLIRLSKKNPRASATDLNAEIRTNYGVQVSVDTVRRRQRDGGLHGRRPAKKPLMREKNRKARLAFAKKFRHWTPAQWAHVLWSDESKFNLFGSDGVQYVRRPTGQRMNYRYMLPTVKHGGGNVMVWGCFSRTCLGPLHQVVGIMDQVMYREIIEDVMLPHAKKKMGRGWIFQQDNDPKHTSRSVKAAMDKKKIHLLEWPSQSPDLNPIEHLWEELDRRCKGRQPRNQSDLFDILQAEWEKIPISVLNKLVDSMPRRCEEVINPRDIPPDINCKNCIFVEKQQNFVKNNIF
jgi:transposase